MMTILLDDDQHQHPTFMNIIEAFKSLSEQSQPGDVVFIQFAGHGGRILDSPIDPQVESYDEMIAPSDYSTVGLIRDTLIFKTLLAPMRYGVTVTILIDCCDTGMVLDLPYSWSTRSDKPDALAKMTQSDDFSFVRFLKVVKTLYESSTFTQLGKTVGTALGHQPAENESFEEDGTVGEIIHTRQGIDRRVSDDLRPASGQSIFPSLCLSPRHPSDPSGCSRTMDQDALSLLEKVFGCNFLVPEGEDELSDEETFGNHTYDDDHITQNSTFDSVSEGEYNKRRGRSRRHRRV